MAVDIKEDGETTLAIPTAILGIDMTKFQQTKLELRSGETFDENLKRLFGISADQAAEIVNYSEISNMIIVEEPAIVGAGRGQKGGVKGVQSLVSLIAGAVALMNNLNTVVEHVVEGVTLVDRASGSLAETSKLKKTAELWREEMNTHCPKANNVPVACGFFDVKCKVWDYEETGKARGEYDYHSELCTLASKKYNAASVALPDAQRAALEAAGAGAQGIINLSNTVSLSKGDVEALKKAKILDEKGVVINAKGLAKYFETLKAKASKTDATDGAPAPEAAEGAEAPRGKKSRKAEAPEDAVPEDPAIAAAVAAAKADADERAAAAGDASGAPADAPADAAPDAPRGREADAPRPRRRGGAAPAPAPSHPSAFSPVPMGAPTGGRRHKTRTGKPKRRVTRRKAPGAIKFVY